MTEPASDRPPRRPRYRGKNPRHFHEKYKEHQPDRYAADVAKVLASGKTPAGMHRPVLLNEILACLAPKPGDVVLDCTLGYGGHARELLAAIQPGGKLLCTDVDPVEIARTEARLRGLGYPDDSLIVRRMNFAGVVKFIEAESPGGVDVMLADLGVSSMQIDDPARGFSFKFDGPLDMRMNPGRGTSAAALLAQLDEDSLARILSENADEPHPLEMAQQILLAQSHDPITTTRALVDVVSAAYDRYPRQFAGSSEVGVRRVFQALRIAVNDELGALSALLRNIAYCLKPGGRLAILTFHSGEDRRVKLAFKEGLQSGIYSSISEEVIRASPEEQRANPRSCSAKLRFAIRAFEPDLDIGD
ncbi:MAG: 16S rRNA (cytosine(1402)-N(4))-methyltransferase RsmH [Planctomycetes bacterium]|nr:16S rRNA (cytosine(1402)-N(4))-methyltransferase RsmH [Planctomycetota bacterium]